MVNIDTVYQRVLAIANKEQRGYITPQEFNLYANQAQMDIFEQYFYDLNQFMRLPGNDTEYSDMVNILEEKINIFETSTSPLVTNNSVDMSTISNFYRLGTVQLSGIEVEKVEHKDFKLMDRLPLAKPTTDRPVFYIKGNTMHIRPLGLQGNLVVHYVRRPLRAEWGYVVANEKALYNAVRSTDFQLHASEETDLTIKILALAGIMMDDQALYQIASQEDIKNVQQEKQ